MLPPAAEAPDQEPGHALAGRDDVTLRGATKNRLDLGPVPEGRYGLAIRPSGFGRWTWVGDTEDRRRAVPMTVGSAAVGGPTASVTVFCRPGVSLAPSVRTGAPLPDLREVTVTASVLDEVEEHPIAEPPSATAARAHVDLEGLPLGRQRLVFSFEHPHLLPTPTVTWEAVLSLARGDWSVGTPEIDQVGGALEVKGPWPAVRVQPGVGPARIVVAAAGRFDVPSLPAGHYRVDTCADSECLTATPRWPAVAVGVGETVVLDGR